MILYPAVDIRAGAAVRLTQGDYARETRYDERPERAAKRWESEGARWLHVVDLDGALEGAPRNLDAIARIISEVRIPVQVGGGIRTVEGVSRLLDLGAARVVLGTAAIANPEILEEAARRFPDRVTLGLDARDGKVAVRGWRETSGESAADVARRFEGLPLAALVYTDIEVDGTLRGPNLRATEGLARATRIPVIASGGIGSLAHLRLVAALASAGVAGVIVGRALYTGDVTLAEALPIVEGPNPSSP